MLTEMTSRRSIRKYIADKPIEEEKLIEIIESARIAPSGSNTQPWHFIVIKSDEMRQRLADASHDQQWMMTAPVYIACIADIQARFKENMDLSVDENSPQFELKQAIRDTTIAIEHMVLSAENLGLGTCWVAWFTQKDIRPILNLPSDKFVVAIITLGYPAESPKARPRKALEDILRYETWQ